MIRTLVATGVFAVAGFAGIAAAPAASADQFCQTVDADTVATSPILASDCVPNPLNVAPECVFDAPTTPVASAYVEVCVPTVIN